MVRCLILISLVSLFPFSVVGQARVGGKELSVGSSQYYNAQIILPKAEVTGICILKADSDGVAGCLVNEFGIKALDFTYDDAKQRIKLHSVISFMDKWYIRCTLRKDISLLLREKEVSQKNYVRQTIDDGSIRLENKKRKIVYILTPISQDEASR